MKARIADFAADMISGKQRLTLQLDGDFRADFDKLRDIDVEVTIKPYREKRSKNANAYLWELIGKESEVLNLPSVYIYQKAIREVGQWKDFHNMDEADAKTLMTAWGKLGLGWFAQQLDYEPDGEHVVVRCWYGSSAYNSKRFSMLLDFVIADCKELGIETLPPAELAALMDDWQRRKENNNGTNS